MAQVEGHILRYAKHVHFAYVLHGGATDKKSLTVSTKWKERNDQEELAHMNVSESRSGALGPGQNSSKRQATGVSS
jgi:hypothetical protein